MFELIEWKENLDLLEFYNECSKRGYENNSSQKKMIDCFKNEKTWNCWILYFKDKAIGSVAAHSFNEVMGPNTTRVLTRTCAFREYAPNKGLITPRTIKNHQNFTDQYFLPKSIEYAEGNRIFATSNESSVGSQRLVNNYYFPTLQKLGLVKLVDKVFYRGLEQNVWEIFKQPFLQHLNKYPRWIN